MSLRDEIAELHGLSPAMAERLKGQSAADLDADAKVLAALQKDQEPTTGERIVEALSPVRKHQRDRALVDAAHPAGDSTQ